MKTKKDSISVRQLFFVFTIIVSSPVTRFLPKYSAAKAQQAGWVSPIVSIVPFIALVLIADRLLNKYKEQSMAEIITNLLGKYLGKLVLVLYLLWAFYVEAMYIRFYAERLTGTIYPNINNNILIMILLIPIAYMLHSGFTVIARISEIILPFIGAILVLLTIFLLNRVRVDNLLPVYFNDIIPIIRGSYSMTGVIAYMFLLFFLGDRLVNLKSLRKFGYISAAVNISSATLVNLITIGVMSSSITRRNPAPVLSVVKQISILDTIENIEVIVVAIWVFADFILVSTLFTVLLKLLKAILGLSDTKPLINMLAVLLYFLSLGVTARKFEMDEFSDQLVLPMNIVMGYIIPAALFVLSMVRKKPEQKKS